MTRPNSSLEPAYFENMFRSDDDPWELGTSPYEQEKFAHTIRALSGRTYAHGFEVGCAKGVLTEKLAPLCKDLLAIDVSATALKAAQARCANFGHVSFALMAFPKTTPEGAFDLILLSEVVYYWDDDDIGQAAHWVRSHLAAGGDLLLVHWTGETDYPQSGDGAVSKLQALLADTIDIVSEERRTGYRLDLWRRRA